MNVTPTVRCAVKIKELNWDKPLLSFDWSAFQRGDGLRETNADADERRRLEMGTVPKRFRQPGAQIAVVSGDLFKEGRNVVRLKMPGGYKIREIIDRPNTSR